MLKQRGLKTVHFKILQVKTARERRNERRGETSEWGVSARIRAGGGDPGLQDRQPPISHVLVTACNHSRTPRGQ